MSKKVATKTQLGQTLIETLVAIFIIITALITAASLAYFSLRSNDNSSRQIIGAALAREALEAVKNMRDSNWQAGTLSDCSAQMGAGQSCYTNWLGSGATALAQGDYSLDFNPTTNAWVLTSNPVTAPNYQLNYNSSNNTYSYPATSNPSGFFRRVNITYDTAAPYSASMPRVIVSVMVWWTSRQCPAISGDNGTWTTLSANCKIFLQSHLTNWRNY